VGRLGRRAPRGLREPALIFGRRRFADTIERQLDLFARESADLLADVEEAERTYDRAERDEAEDAYGDYQDRVEWAAEELAKLRDTFAASLDDDAGEAYVAAFDRAAARRFPRLGAAVRRS
jgi:hypothetical protein